MNYKTQEQWVKRAEDVILAMSHLLDQSAAFPKEDYKAKSLRRGAVIIQLVIATKLQEVIDCLDADKIANATDVLSAVAQVADRRSEEIPVVKTGQGDTERMIYERDLLGEVNKLSAMRKLTDMWRQKKWGAK